jgi:hypothetical protein
MRWFTPFARRSRPVEDYCHCRIYSFAAFVCSEQMRLGQCRLPDLCLSRPAPARCFLPLTGKDKDRAMAQSIPEHPIPAFPHPGERSPITMRDLLPLLLSVQKD